MVTVAGSSRNVSYPTIPSQNPACRFPAPGSSGPTQGKRHLRTDVRHDDFGQRVFAEHSVIPPPAQPTLLTPTTQPFAPGMDGMVPELFQDVMAATDPIVLVDAAKGGHQIRMLPADFFMTMDSTPCGHPEHGPLHPLPHRLPLHQELTALALAADMGEPQKVEGFWLSLSPTLPALGRKPPKFEQPRLLRMQFQSEFVQPLLERFVDPLRVFPVLKTDDDVSSQYRMAYISPRSRGLTIRSTQRSNA